MLFERPNRVPSVETPNRTGSHSRFARRIMWMVLILALTPAMMGRAGHSQDLADANDTAGLMDARAVATSGPKKRPTWRVVTFSKWEARDIWDRGQILVLLDTFGDGGPDYYALVHSAGPKMHASLWRIRAGRRDQELEDLRVWRKDGRSVSVIVPLKGLRLEDERPYYRWRIETIWRSKACPRVCFDLVPDDGFVREPLVTASPTPGPSQTNNPLPTLSPLPTPEP